MRSLALIAALLSTCAAAVPQDVRVQITEQDLRMSRPVPISLDGGKSWTNVWAGIKTGHTSTGEYNFFCAEVRMPSTFGKQTTYTAAHDASPPVRALVSRAHDLSQLNPDAAAAMQLVLWDLQEDGEADLRKGSFQARPSPQVKLWADLFKMQSNKPELEGSRVTILRSHGTQDVVVMDYGKRPVVPLPEPAYGGRAVPDPRCVITDLPPACPPTKVPEPGTLLLLGLSLVALATFLRSK